MTSFLRLRGPLAAISFALFAACAQAHPTFETSAPAAGASVRPLLRVPHGCKGSATKAIHIRIPEGVIGAKPMPRAGWTLTIAKGPYARTYATMHGEASAGAKELVWSGGLLPDDQYDEFVFSAALADTFAPGDAIYFRVLQDCVDRSVDWADIPAAGQDAHTLQAPAPFLRIASAAHASAPSVFRAGALVVDTPWIRATPGGAKVAGGFAKIVNSGPAADRLVGASLRLAGRGEVHEMSVHDGVMKMRALERGLDIPADGSVELRPGGFHLMFLDLGGPMVEGQTVEGALNFEKAGSVPVVFTVGGLGATAPGHAHAH